MQGEFKVVYPAHVRAVLSEICVRARGEGMVEEVLKAIKTIDDELKSKPWEFGDPVGAYQEMGLDMFTRGVSPLFVRYGVHRSRPIVFVHTIAVFPSSGL